MKKRKTIYQLHTFKTKAIDHENFTVDGVFSTADEDRHGDNVIQNFDLKAFKDNPVILNSHNYNDIGDVIGMATKIGIKSGNLAGQIKFAVDENPKAKIAFDLYAGGFLNTFSIGFIPTKFNEDDMSIIEKSELLEISAVSVPANARALAKAKGIDVDSYDPEVKKIKKKKKSTKKVKDAKIKTKKLSIKKVKELVNLATDVPKVQKTVGTEIKIKKQSVSSMTAEAIKNIGENRRKKIETLSSIVRELNATPMAENLIDRKIELKKISKIVRNLADQRNDIDNTFKRR